MTTKRAPYANFYQDVNRQQYGEPISIASPFTDSFGFLRVTSPYTIFDSKLLEDKQPLFWDEQESGGTSVHSASLAMVGMHLTGNDGDYCIRQTYQRCAYQPGRSQLALFTGKMSIEADVEKRIGLVHGSKNAPYDVTDGLYWMMSGSQMCCVESRAGVHQVYPQSEWNYDTLDGTGVSKISASWDMNQIFGITYAWLGVGRVTYFLNINGLNVPVHSIDHANHTSQDGAYISSPSMPIRYEIRSAGGAGSLNHICSMIASEGGVSSRGVNRAASTKTVSIAGNSVGTWYVLAGVRLTSSYYTIEPLDLTVLDDARGDLTVRVVLNPVVTGSFNWTGVDGVEIMSGSGASYTVAEDPNAMGEILYDGFGADKLLSADLNNSVAPGMAIDGTPDELYVIASPLDVGSSLYGSMVFKVTD